MQAGQLQLHGAESTIKTSPLCPIPLFGGGAKRLKYFYVCVEHAAGLPSTKYSKIFSLLFVFEIFESVCCKLRITLPPHI